MGDRAPLQKKPAITSSPTPAPLVQREEKKPKAEASGERTGTKEGKDKFSFQATLTLPLFSGLKLGPVSFLDSLKLTGSGEIQSDMLGIFPMSSNEFKTQLALDLAKLELANVKEKEDALRKGKLTFGTTLSASGGPTFSFNPFTHGGSIVPSLTLKGGATTPSLIPSPYGNLTFGSSLTLGGSVTDKFGEKSGLTSKADGKFGLSADYESPAFRNPALTLGGILGDSATITAGLSGTASGSLSREQPDGAPQVDKATGELGGGGTLGLTGKGKGVERFIKIEVKGAVGITRETGKVDAHTQSIFLGATTGFKF